MKLILIYFLNFGLLGFAIVSARPCALRKYEAGYVCVCNATYCDSIQEINVSPETQGYYMVSSSKGALRFYVTTGRLQNHTDMQRIEHKIDNHFRRLYQEAYAGTSSDNTLNPKPKRFTERIKNVTILVDRRIEFQKIIGFGGAFTGSVSYLLEKLDSTLQTYIYKSYFSQTEGIAYSMLRIPIGGCDFDLEPWAYNEYPVNDIELSNFTELDGRDLIKIRQIEDLIETSSNNNIKFIGAAWSPPRWMKSNNEWSGHNFLKPEYYQTWADYHIRFLELMTDKNINFWGISTGNEPLNGHYFWLFVKFMSLGWSSKNQALWLNQHLGPTLRNHNYLGDVKLLGGDDQRYVFPWWFEMMNEAHQNVTQYLNGFAVHWYWDGIAPLSFLDRTHTKYPNHFILNTESCIGDKPFDRHGPILGSWKRAEQYITSYMEDLKHWVSGWIDWNLILDENGGPNYVHNFVEAPIIINSTSFNEFYKQPIFYAIGHFSRFIPEDSVRIDVKSSDDKVLAIGFQHPDFAIAIIFYNKHTEPVNIDLHDSISGKLYFQIPAKSIHSLVYY